MLRSTLFAGGLVAALFLWPGLSAGQTVSIVSGNGQLVCPVCPGNTTEAFTPLVVSVADSSGNPLPNTSVTWTVTPGTGSGSGTGPTTAHTTTGATGQASYTFPLILPQPGFQYFQTTIKATVATSTVQFIETTAVPGNNSPGPPIFISLVTPLPGQAYTGMAGTTSSTLIKVDVVGINGGISGPIAGVAVRIASLTSPGPTLNCVSQAGQQPYTVLTDATGYATCTPVFGGMPGNGNYQIKVGGIYNSFLPGPLTVTPAHPAMIKLISGNNQSANPSVAFAMPLVAEVDDMAGNPFQGGKVTWAVTQGTATLSNIVATSAANGQVSANVTAGGNAGPVAVTVSLTGSTSIQFVFMLNVNSVYNQLQIISGNSQSQTEGLAFADPLIVQVNDQPTSQVQATPVPGVTVNFTVTGGSATLSASSAVTNAQGQAMVTVTAGATVGPVVITASVSAASVPAVTFNLTVAPPGPMITSINNAAGFQPNFISPCSLATLYGTGIVPGIQGGVSAFIEPPLQLAGVSVTFAGVPAPILSVVNENGQQSVSIQVPCEVTPGMVPGTVTANGGTSPVTFTVLPVSPGIFQTVMSDGKSRAVMVRPDGSFVQLENPARRGETIRAYVTGLGQTSPALTTDEFLPLVPDSSGVLVPEIQTVNAKTIVGVNNAGVLELSATYAYGLVGVYEMDFVVPMKAATGPNVVFAIAVFHPDGSAVFGNSTFMPIE